MVVRLAKGQRSTCATQELCRIATYLAHFYDATYTLRPMAHSAN